MPVARRAALATLSMVVAVVLFAEVWFQPIYHLSSVFGPNANVSINLFLNNTGVWDCSGSGCPAGYGGTFSFTSQYLVDLYVVVWLDILAAIAVGVAAIYSHMRGFGRVASPLRSMSLSAASMGIGLIAPVALVLGLSTGFSGEADWRYSVCFSGGSPCSSFYGTNGPWTWGPGIGWWLALAGAAAALASVLLTRVPRPEPRRLEALASAATVVAAMAAFSYVFTDVWRNYPSGSNIWLLPLVFFPPGVVLLWLWLRAGDKAMQVRSVDRPPT
ncbi:MAG TPA: hypothetical protein VEY07_04290 [Thermoplasmata archaeon]|nr:hypothetical protein [Thermoplasmata archaeon]